MSTITKERAQQIFLGNGPEPTASEERELARIALASIEAVPVAYIREARRADGFCFADGIHPTHRHQRLPLSTLQDGCYWVVTPLYAAPPAPVSVPECFKRLLHHAYGMTMGHDWNKGTMAGHHRAKLCQAVEECRAAMLQGSDGTLTNEGTIPVTQFKPVADLYGLTSPTGGETSFTFDAVEARDFIDGGWSCQEYVELERFQEAITNHTEDKLAMVDHSGDSNNTVEPVTTAYKLPFEQWISQQTGTIDVECGCVMTEVFFHWLRVAYEAGNYPVIPDEVLSAIRNVASIRADFDDFDGDRRGIGDCLDEAEQELIVTINKHASVIAAAPQQEAENRIQIGKSEAKEEWDIGARLTKHRFKP